jgi:ABC-type uncharacterized transport system permease subunit
MRFEVVAAYVMGVALPVLEVARRRTNFDNIPTYIDDILAGALLLIAARSVSRGKPHGGYLLAGAWGIVFGGLWGSFFSQLRVASDVSGYSNTFVIAVKGVLFAVAAAAFVASVWRGPVSHMGSQSGRAPS